MSQAGGLRQAYSLSELSRGERLLVRTLRRLARGWDLCAGLTREFADTCGKEQAAEVIGTLRLFLGTVGCTARRRVTVAPPGWSELTADERQILSLIAAAQEADEPRLAALVCWFARLEVQPLLSHASRELAMAFASHELGASSLREVLQ